MTSYAEFVATASTGDRPLINAFREICSSHGVRLADVFHEGRKKTIMAARRACWSEQRRRGWSYPEIGELWGRDHTTVMAAVKRIPGPVAPPDLEAQVERLVVRLAVLEEEVRHARTRISDLEKASGMDLQ